MNEPLDARAKRVFDLVIDQNAAQRARHLDSTCVGDPELRARVEALLGAAEQDDVFLKDPTLGPGLVEPADTTDVGVGGRIGSYALRERIGEGGFGTVYLAEQSEPVRRQVALKIVKPGMDTKQVIARFEAERQVLAIMDHPNIARVFEAGATEQGRPYFVMELVRGEPVTRYCDQKRLTIEQRLALFRDFCGAVQHAHQKGVIHRDIKPSNILVAGGDGEPVVKVIDFGIARAITGRLTDQSLTEVHQVIGTPEYMSPEQAGADSFDIDTRSDIYSMGVVLYELLVGTTPLDRETMRSTPMAEIQRRIREVEPLKPSHRLATLAQSSGDNRRRTSARESNPSPGSSAMDIAQCRRLEPRPLTRALRGDLDAIVMKCLEKDRGRRYAAASALADDIGRYLTQQPVLATPPSAGYRLRKFVRRRKGAVLAGTAILLVILAGIVGTTFQARRANRKAQQAGAVNDFMREVLTSVEPQNQGADVRLIEVLSRASLSASTRFAEDPLEEAQVRDLLGQVYERLTCWPEAKTEREKAVSLWRTYAGPDDPRTFDSQTSVAEIALSLEQAAEAENMLAELLPKAERLFGSNDRKTLYARLLQARADYLRGRYKEAESVLFELRAHPALASDDDMRFDILHNLIAIYRRRVPFAERESQIKTWEQIEPLAREWVETSLRRHGPDSSATQNARFRLAEALDGQGQHQASADLCRAILASTEHFGECHQVRAEAMFILALSLTAMGEEKEPAELEIRRIQCMRQKYPANSPLLLGAISDALPFLERGESAAEGEALARELTAGLAEFDHGSSAFTAEMYVSCFVSMQGRREEAETLFQSLFARLSEVSDDDSARARLHMLYAGHLARQGDYSEAEQYLKTASSILGDVRQGTRESHPDDLIHAFVKLYEKWGRPDQADEYRRLLGSGRDISN